jgi:hypothetical protein
MQAAECPLYFFGIHVEDVREMWLPPCWMVCGVSPIMFSVSGVTSGVVAPRVVFAGQAGGSSSAVTTDWCEIGTRLAAATAP